MSSPVTAVFTPGPWVVRSAKTGIFNISAAKKSICNTPTCYRDDALGLNLANARLIASAPELYEALTEALFAIDSGQLTGPGAHAFADSLRPALAKARGQ
jgi:uncharacterized protein YegP (UPF0339 family)